MRPWLLVLTGILLSWKPALAQDDAPAAGPGEPGSVPILTAIFPPGLTVGTTTDWVVTGRNLAAVERFVVTGNGITITRGPTRSDGSLAVQARAEVGAEPGYRDVRAEGPFGISNPLMIRVDHLPQVIEAEPNDTPEQARAVATPSAVAGILLPGDVDHVRVRGRPGQRITVEVEARRLGTPVDPVLTIMRMSANTSAQGGASRGIEQDCRLSYVVPAEGDHVIQVRDRLYEGNEAATYRLRIHDAPYATGLFPLGGPSGGAITVVASGGSLPSPRSRVVALPDRPGEVIDLGPFEGPGGPVLAPARLIVGEGPEREEDSAERREGMTVIPIGTTMNGRLGRPGEVDRFRIPVKAGESIRIRVRAAELGSWLDSVLTLRDARGTILGENDDHGLLPDSVIDHEARTDGDLIVELADRYGAGGPEYAYRLSAGPIEPDVAVSLQLNGRDQALGALNLHPGESASIRVRILAEGRPGLFRVRALGLPPGVTALPITVRSEAFPGQSPALGSTPGVPLVLRVAPDAQPASSTLRVVAARLGGSDDRSWVASVRYPVGPDLSDGAGRRMSSRRVVRVATDLSVRVVVPLH
jgi:hypothetical protein